MSQNMLLKWKKDNKTLNAMNVLQHFLARREDALVALRTSCGHCKDVVCAQ